MEREHWFWAQSCQEGSTPTGRALLGVDRLAKVRQMLSQAKQVGALAGPPRDQEVLRHWIALASAARDLDALRALAPHAKAEAFEMQSMHVGLAKMASDRRCSAWHLALMVDSQAERWEQNPEALNFLLALPACREAMAMAPCPRAIAKARPSLARIKAWTTAAPELLAKDDLGCGLGHWLAANHHAPSWRACLGFESSRSLRELLTRPNGDKPSALEWMEGLSEMGKAPSQELPALVARTRARVDARLISAGTKRAARKKAPSL